MAVGDGNNVLRWNESAQVEKVDYGFPATTITYDNRKFIALQSGSASVGTTDGNSAFTITTNSGLTARKWSCITNEWSIYIAVANNSNKAGYSKNGTNWNEYDIPQANWKSVVFGKDKFVAVSTDGKCAYTTNGTEWISSGIPDATWEGIAFGYDKFVAISSDGKFTFSYDGIKWSEAKILGNSVQQWNLIAYNSHRSQQYFIVLSTNPSICITSDDGIHWSESTLSSDYTYSTLTYRNDEIIAIGSANVDSLFNNYNINNSLADSKSRSLRLISYYIEELRAQLENHIGP